MTTQSILVSVWFCVVDCFKMEALPHPSIMLDELRHFRRRPPKSTKPLTTKSWSTGNVYIMRQKNGHMSVEYREPLT